VREVDDLVWLVAALVGSALGFVAFAGLGVVPVLSWALVSGLVLEHLVPWDVRVERVSESLPGAVELVLYLGIGLGLLGLALSAGVGSSGIPLEAIAVYASVLLARALFELGVLYGGADAKAIMVAGILVPLDAAPVFHVPFAASTFLAIYPFTLTLLVNAALLAVVVPVGLAVRNALRGRFEFPRAFTGYQIPVAELPRRFVWLRDPTFRPGGEEDEADTAEEDQTLRERQARELAAQGIREVWVTPQLPFVVFLAAGAVAGLLAGNLLFDLLAAA